MLELKMNVLEKKEAKNISFFYDFVKTYQPAHSSSRYVYIYLYKMFMALHRTRIWNPYSQHSRVECRLSIPNKTKSFHPLAGWMFAAGWMGLAAVSDKYVRTEHNNVTHISQSRVQQTGNASRTYGSSVAASAERMFAQRSCIVCICSPLSIQLCVV